MRKFILGVCMAVVLGLVFATAPMLTSSNHAASKKKRTSCPSSYVRVSADEQQSVNRNGDGYVCYNPATGKYIDNNLPPRKKKK